MILNVTEMGAGRPLALLHGLFGQSGNFGTVQRRLAARCRVLAVDLRNHGASPHAPGMAYPTMAADVLETLRARDALPCALLGHSMGGKVAMRLALDAAEAVDRLFVADIAPVMRKPTWEGIAAAMAAIPLAPGLTRAAADEALAASVHTPAVRAFLLQNLRFHPAPTWKIGLSDIAAALPDIEDWPAVPGPPYGGMTLVVAGDRSDYIQPEHRPLFRALFPAVRFATLKAAGHWLHADNPEGFIALAEAFMA